jgi:hypothetical protein
MQGSILATITIGVKPRKLALKERNVKAEVAPPFSLDSQYLPMMSKTGQHIVSAGAMLPDVRGQMCSRAE